MNARTSWRLVLVLLALAGGLLPRVVGQQPDMGPGRGLLPWVIGQKLADVRQNPAARPQALEQIKSELLDEALRKVGVESRFVVVQGARHGFGGPDIERQVVEFFDQNLKSERGGAGTAESRKQQGPLPPQATPAPVAQSAAAPVKPAAGGLVLYLNFKEPPQSGIVHDSSVYGNEGHIEGATWVSDSKHGGAMRFDNRAQNQQIRVANSDSLNPKRITIAAWVKASTANLQTNGCIVDKGNLHGYALYFVQDKATKSIEFQAGQKIACSQKYVPVADGEWHHIAVTYDGHVQLLYVDGKVHGKVYCWRGIVPSDASDLIIGNSETRSLQSSGPGPQRGPPPPAPLAAFDGLIGELRIYKRALDFKEVATLAKTWSFAPSVVSTLPAPSATETIVDQPEETFLHFRPRPNPPNPSNFIQWVDIHNHFRSGMQDPEFNGSMQTALAGMKRIGTSLMIATAWSHNRPMVQNVETFKRTSLKYGGRFYCMATPDDTLQAIAKSASSVMPMLYSHRGASTDKASPRYPVSNEQLQELERESERILQAGACCFGEVFLYHLVGTLDDGGDFCNPADSPHMLLLADIAARHDVPMDVHMDLIDEDVAVPPDIAYLFHNMLPEFERLLSHNPKARIIWEHVGSWAGSSSGHCTPELSRRLLTQHPNLYMSMRISSLRFCWTEEWQQLFQDFPDRFLIGRDCFYPLASDEESQHRPGAGGFEDSSTRMFLDRLPEELARKIAYENAINLFHLSDSARMGAERENLKCLNENAPKSPEK